MSNVTVGLLMGIGFAAWVYSKLMHSTGGNTKNALIVATCAGVGAAVLLTTLLSTFSN
ncbi:MAG: hypothetical protein V4702_05435 [Patescibacteria group bacterium]